MKIGRYRMRFQTTITLMVLSVVALALLALYTMISIEISKHTREGLEQRAVGIARTVAHTETVQKGLEAGGDRAAVQAYAEEVRRANNIQFVVVIDMNGIRLSHPDPTLIGKHFSGGDESPVLRGQESISAATGSLGPSMRAFSPIYGEGGGQVGAVAVGLSLGSVKTAVGQNMWLLYWGILLGGLLGIFGAVLLGRRLKRMMFGMEPDEIARLLEERSAMLQSAKEGILAVDKELRITLINAEAKRLIGEERRPEAAPGGSKPEAREPAADPAESDFRSLLRLERVLASGEPVYNLEVERGGTALLVNVVPVRIEGRVEGAFATFRDKTEIALLMERLSGISLYADALRAQTHEFMNKLHIIMGLTHMKRYDRLEEYLQEAVPSLQIEAGAVATQVKDPVMAGFLLGKLSLMREAGIRLTVREDGVLPEAAEPAVSRELVTIVGNLLQNAMEAPRPEDTGKEIEIGFVYAKSSLEIGVRDNGTGISGEVAACMYEQGCSTKGGDRGVGLYLVRRSAERLGGSVSWESEAGEGTCFVVELPYFTKNGVSG
ncbi:DcuS/MalK family sensor histidine kinase [Saccharibacillus sp. CPCC 101409]|uniref:DcuS/MalK family sensor histidine kinase n=1 Tax=Saccharibacillus sp. CPCC 101409 TaxID=3058041 RepID=UPI0026731EEF|nr:DcuS/MalK family sensor histidine kinase [Saccharibacillus sp. CPCC 101409]MDO3410023.1 DcuS/MalK family sensor histidine kinase [Saccharibacillus sp. CPCC 101409]